MSANQEPGNFGHTSPRSEKERTATVRSQRLLACLLCQQRKIKCDRAFPCQNCVRIGVQCTPGNAIPPRQRRRRFPEKDLLDRLRHYETILRQNEIKFEPLHPSSIDTSRRSPGEASRQLSESTSRVQTAVTKPEEAVNLWHAISRVTLDSEDDDDDEADADANSDDLRDAGEQDTSNFQASTTKGGVFKISWQNRFTPDDDHYTNDKFLLGSDTANVDLLSSHPQQSQSFRLWQIYLDNVNPLLKVTHTPTLQPRIINAASDTTNINPTLEALMFSIYCISVVSISNDECYSIFQCGRRELLQNFQAACQKALVNCGLWRSNDREGLTAMFLYLLSLRVNIDPRTLSCMLAIATRIGQHMGLHNEATYSGLNALEAEMRRRLWWSLVMFDHRVSELSDYKATTLDPIWECNIPLNLSDFELRPDMTTPPPVHTRPTEVLFALVRSEMADVVRHSAFHLNFVNPHLKSIAQSKVSQQDIRLETSELISLERLIETKYLNLCDAEDPLHFMTLCTARGYLARNRLLEHYAKHSSRYLRPSDAQRNDALVCALSMLEHDTKMRKSPLTQGFVWFGDLYFPALAYIHILNAVARKPGDNHSKDSWNKMNENYEAILATSRRYEGDELGGVFGFFLKFWRVVVQAWQAREKMLKDHRLPPETVPQFVSDIRDRSTLSTSVSTLATPEFQQQGSEDSSMAPDSFGHGDLPADPSGDQFKSEPLESSDFGSAFMQPDVLEQAMMDLDVDRLWTDNYWTWMQPQGWGN